LGKDFFVGGTRMEGVSTATTAVSASTLELRRVVSGFASGPVGSDCSASKPLKFII
jgi:hypothetical protein